MELFIATAMAGMVALGEAAYTGNGMITEWGAKVTAENAWREYPRPQMERANWQCLNGYWDYAVTSVTNTPGRPKAWDGKILVPFVIESRLSGVGRLLEPSEFLWYTRKLTCHPVKGRRILLNFEGVDFRAMVFIGHREVTDVPHGGAQEPFSLDITDFVKDGENELTLCVWDPSSDRSNDAGRFVNSSGKQSMNPKGCFYTRTSGIWQTVWMEEVPESYIADYNVTPDFDGAKATFDFAVKGPRLMDGGFLGFGGNSKVKLAVFDGAEEVATAEFLPDERGEVTLPKDFKPWSPEHPHLYTFTARYGEDEVKGHFAMRKFEKRKDAKGILRFFLNNEPYYILGTLDQGWWPDGLLTPPSDEAMVFDVKTLKSCGFNMLRKHIKVEPRRYYWHCDRLGILLLQDLPSGASDPRDFRNPAHVRPYGFQRLELKRMIDELRKVPSIVMWIPYNEGWSEPGEFLTHSTLDWVKRYDPSRLVNGPSGWNDFEGGRVVRPRNGLKGMIETDHRSSGECEAADVIDRHDYRGPSMFPVNDRRVSFLGEFGGLGHPVAGHLWKVPKDGKGNWGYGGIQDTATREGLEQVYLGLMDKLGVLAEQGLAGSVYTQTTDVEIEINGIMTYDRKVLKYNAAKLKAAHDAIRARALKAAR